jgi:glycerol-3-phosphate acyltransferase PlsY
LNETARVHHAPWRRGFGAYIANCVGAGDLTEARSTAAEFLAALTAIALICGLEQPLPYRLLVFAGGIYVIVRHRANIQRLLAGTEPRLGQSSPESKAELQI